MNSEIFAILAVWSAVVVTLAWILSRWVLRAPRLKAIIVLTAFVCTLAPFLADSLPSVPISLELSGAADIAPTPPPTIDSTAGTSSLVPTPTPSLTTPAPPQIPWIEILSGIWVTGSLFCFARLLLSIYRMNRFSREGDPGGPMVAGFPRPRILLPSDWPGELTPEEAEAALAHEHAHIRRFHVPGRIISELFRGWLWWLPTAHLAVRTYENSLEEIADAEALRTCRPQALASALLKVASRVPQPYLCTGATTSGRDLETRIRHIMNKRTPGRLSVAVVLAFSGAAFALAFAPRLPLLADDFALQKGASYTYEVTYFDAKGKPIVMLHPNPDPNDPKPIRSANRDYAYKVDAVISKGKDTVYRLKHFKPVPFYKYQGVGKDGFLEIPLKNPQVAQNGKTVPDYDLSKSFTMLKKPYRVGTKWTGQVKMPGHPGQGKKDSPAKAMPYTLKYESKIESEVTITVPAGTYKCFLVKTISTSASGGNTVKPLERTDWISPKVGIVKTEARDDNRLSSRTTLKEFKAK